MKRLAALLPSLLFACSSSSPQDPARGPAPVNANAAAPAPAVNVPPPDPREQALTQAILELMQGEHLLRPKIDDSVSKQAFETYIDHLDGGKAFLVQADRDAMVGFADKIDDELRAGNLKLAHEGAKRYAARVAIVAKMVQEILAQPFDFTNEEWLETDPEKLALAKDDAELRERWRQRLELEVMERVASMDARLKAEAEKAEKTKKAKKPNTATPKKPGPGDEKPVDEVADEDDERTTTPLKDIPATPEAREAKARADIGKAYESRFARLQTQGPLDAAADLINAVAQTIDPHTQYMPPADKANFDIQMSGTLEGIGAVLREKDHLIEISELVPGGAAARQGGVAQGDLIMSVQQGGTGTEPVDVFDMRIDEVVKMIRGKKGTVVKLRVQKAGGTEETVTITRDEVVLEASYARGAIVNKKGSGAYGYIHLPSFYGGKGAKGRSASVDVRRLLAQMKTKKVGGVILDLRSNGGGLLVDSVDLTGEFIDKGPVVQVKGSRGDAQLLDDDRPGVEFDKPLIVMVDQFSASASEIVAGALQDYKRALIVGTSATHGKGTVQTLADLDAMTGGRIELGVLKLTIQQFFRVSGSSTQRQGVTPDVLLPNPTGHIDSGERELPHALAWSQIPAAPHADVVPTWSATDLATLSAARVAKQPILSKVATTTTLLRERQKDTKIPLQRTAWEKRREELRAALKAVSPDLAKTAPTITVAALDDATPPPPPAAGAVKVTDPLTKWRENLARDPWVEETISIMDDMIKPAKATAAVPAPGPAKK